MEQEEKKEKQGLGAKKSLSNDDDDEFGEFSGTTEAKEESLLCLVQNEIATLSCHWIALLRDYAYLSLPPGFF